MTRAVGGKRVFYARFLNDFGKIAKTKSLSEAKTKDEAIRLAESMMHDRADLVFDYVAKFWHDDNPYFKKAEKPYSSAYISGMRNAFERRGAIFIKNLSFSDITSVKVISLQEEMLYAGHSHRQIDNAIQSITVPVNYYFRHKNIDRIVRYNRLVKIETKAKKNREYYLYKRGKFFYVELIDDNTGKRLTKSTGSTDRNEADGIARGYFTEQRASWADSDGVSLGDDILTRILNAISNKLISKSDLWKIERAIQAAKSSDEKLIDFLNRFWAIDGIWQKDRSQYGHSIGWRHLYEMLNRVKTYWAKYFSDRTISDILAKDIVDFSLQLSGAANSKNKILSAGKVALKWAFRNGLIANDIMAGAPCFSEDKSGEAIEVNLSPIDKAYTKWREYGILPKMEFPKMFMIESIYNLSRDQKKLYMDKMSEINKAIRLERGKNE